MRQWLLCIACCMVCLTGCTQPKHTDTKTESQNILLQQSIRIYALGDSLTAGYMLDIADAYPAQLQKLLHGQGYIHYEVINGGKSGDTSEELKRRLAWTTADAQSGDIAIVVIGANDAFRGEQIPVLEQNLDEIVGYLSERGMRVVIGGMEITTNYSQAYRDAFRQVYVDVALRYGADLIPFFLQPVATNPDVNLPDGIHPNQTGYSILAQYVYDELHRFGILP